MLIIYKNSINIYRMINLMINTDLDNNNRPLKNKNNDKNTTNTKNLLITSPKKYIEHYYYKDMKNISASKKRKVSADNFRILNLDEYDKLLDNNYNVSQLKKMCKHNRYKTTGNKSELIKRLYNSMRLSYYAIKIQSRFRMMLIKNLFRMKKLHLLKNSINEIDFLSLEPVKNLSFEQIICIPSGEKKHVYCFDICSLQNYFKEQYEQAKRDRKNIQKHMKNILNPFNRQPFPPYIHKKLHSIIKYSKLCNLNINVSLNNANDLDLKKTNVFKAIELFQAIDSFGFITDSKWLLELRASKLIRFLNELIDIWNYRAQLTTDTKSKIFPYSSGNPFRVEQHLYTKDIEYIKHTIIKILAKFISAGIDKHSQSLAVFYVLGSLTIVSRQAAENLPWLYESFSNVQVN
jgi:hypothetical protein